MKTPYEEYLQSMQDAADKLATVKAVCWHPGNHTQRTPKDIGEYTAEYVYKCKCNYCGKWWVEDQ